MTTYTQQVETIVTTRHSIKQMCLKPHNHPLIVTELATCTNIQESSLQCHLIEQRRQRMSSVLMSSSMSATSKKHMVQLLANTERTKSNKTKTQFPGLKQLLAMI